jgi:hypothetical protein
MTSLDVAREAGRRSRVKRGTRYTHRIRRCRGNESAWCLVALRDDGTEIESFGGYITAFSIDELLKRSRGLLPTPDDVVQICYYSGEESGA